MKIKREYYQKIHNVLKNLQDLEIPHKQRKELIKENYGCLERISGFPENLEKSIKKNLKRNLKGNKAYKSIVKDFTKYDKKLVSLFTQQEMNFPTREPTFF